MADGGVTAVTQRDPCDSALGHRPSAVGPDRAAFVTPPPVPVSYDWLAAARSRPKGIIVRDVRSLINAAWKRREPVFWVLLVALAVGTQWPMLKGWYYRASGTPDPSTSIAWRTNLSSALGEAKERGITVPKPGIVD